VGGRLGAAIGAKLADLARNRTVIVVTHTPQLAAVAERHYAVRKLQGKLTTMVEVEEIADGKRLTELADMLGGGAAALGQAKALLAGAHR
jgi:DNA repair protein RecN (Recombination protein N)